MYYAIYNNEKISPTNGVVAKCQICNGDLIAKCGEINAWHWAHKSLKDCDSWSEPESEWHLNWKNKFPKEFQEVVIGNHRADVKLKNGLVIELQNSPISICEIQERENFYKNMIWIFNVKDCIDNIELRQKKSSNGVYYTFRWKHPRKHISFTTQPTYLDFGYNDIFCLKKMSSETPCGGWGYFKPIKW
jgi:competence CoiA-like predicted nuclease